MLHGPTHLEDLKNHMIICGCFQIQHKRWTVFTVFVLLLVISMEKYHRFGISHHNVTEIWVGCKRFGVPFDAPCWYCLVQVMDNLNYWAMDRMQFVKETVDMLTERRWQLTTGVYLGAHDIRLLAVHFSKVWYFDIGLIMSPEYNLYNITK